MKINVWPSDFHSGENAKLEAYVGKLGFEPVQVHFDRDFRKCNLKYFILTR